LVDEQYAVERLVTTTSRATGRSTVHGTPPHLLRARADRIGLSLEIIELAGRDLDGYLVTMDAHGTALVEEGIAAIAFGDLSVSGALALKERRFSPLGLEIVEPLWGLTSDEVMSGLLGSAITAGASSGTRTTCRARLSAPPLRQPSSPTSQRASTRPANWVSTTPSSWMPPSSTPRSRWKPASLSSSSLWWGRRKGPHLPVVGPSDLAQRRARAASAPLTIEPGVRSCSS
jgi:hypothetical protein